MSKASNTLKRAINKSIGQASRTVNSAVKKGSIRALNRAGTSARAEMARLLRQDTGLKKKDIDPRVAKMRATKTTSSTGSYKATVLILTKMGIPLDKFKPRRKTVTIPGIRKPGQRGRPKSRKRVGVTVKLPGQSRELIPGAFYQQVGNGYEMVLARKDALDASGKYTGKKTERYKTVRLRAKVVLPSAKAHAPKVLKHMKEVFDKNISHEIDFAVKQKLSSDE